jgi:phosphotriesterase-related protein
MADVMTVLGCVDADDLGPTLPHEHLFTNLTKQILIGGVINDRRLVAQEVERFAAVGGRTIVELTTSSIGRKPAWLREISELTGVNVVMGCGFYREPYIDSAAVDRASVEELAESMVREIEDGIDGVRPGVIGEVGSEEFILSTEERCLRASAQAQQRTGLSISTHAGRWPNGLRQLDILESEGTDPRRVIIGHADTIPDPEYHLAIVERGAYVEFDTIRGSSRYNVETRIGYIENLVSRGYGRQILLSQDVCLTTHLYAEGGGGYSYVHTGFRDELVGAGFDSSTLDDLLVRNPARALSGTR